MKVGRRKVVGATLGKQGQAMGINVIESRYRLL